MSAGRTSRRGWTPSGGGRPGPPAITLRESGQHSTSVQTLQRLAEALEMRFVMGFEHGPADKPVRELVPA